MISKASLISLGFKENTPTSYSIEFEGYIIHLNFYEKGKYWWIQLRDTKLDSNKWNDFFALRRHFYTMEELNELFLGLTGKIIQSV